LGTAGIARKNWQAVHRAGSARLVAVGSRDAAKAKAFIAECQRRVPLDREPEAVAGYEAILARDDVDAVYLPLPTGARAAWAIRAAEAGKHVLVEKPCGTSVGELEAIVAACRKAGVQFMDGVMFLHSRRLDLVRHRLADAAGGVGDIRRIMSQFSYRAPPDFLARDIRMHSDLEPLGCLGDLGWYSIAFTLWALAPRSPVAATGRIVAAASSPGSPRPVPVEFVGDVFFPAEGTQPATSTSFFCSFLVEHQQWAHVSGTRGSLRIDDFVLPYFGNELSFTVSHPDFVHDGCDFRMERHDEVVTVAEYGNGHATAQEARLFRDFSALVLSGRTEPRWPETSLAVQRVMMACLESATNGSREIPLAHPAAR
jgi:predicted dehydrogenase